MALDVTLYNAALLASKFPQVMPGLFLPHKRRIAGLAMRVVVEEDLRDEVTVTEHPVEQGAPIADHAFLRQKEVTLRCGWSLWDGDLSAETGVYGILLDMQSSFLLFDLVTGKRAYRNMIMTSLSVSTNQETEFALMATVTCREVILTKTESAKPSTSGDDADKESVDTTGTGSSTSRGPQQATEVTNDVTKAAVSESYQEAGAPSDSVVALAIGLRKVPKMTRRW